jgi:hypothetical protein
MDVDEEVHPKVEMAWKIPMAAPTWRGGIPMAGRRRRLRMGGDCPWRQRPLSHSSSLDLVLVWRRFYPFSMAAKEEDFLHNGWMPPKISFLSIYRGEDVISAIGWMPL